MAMHYFLWLKFTKASIKVFILFLLLFFIKIWSKLFLKFYQNFFSKFDQNISQSFINIFFQNFVDVFLKILPKLFLEIWSDFLSVFRLLKLTESFNVLSTLTVLFNFLCPWIRWSFFSCQCFSVSLNMKVKFVLE